MHVGINKGPLTWFAIDEAGDFRLFATEAEARAAAAAALDDCRKEAAVDGWPEGTANICWGRVCGTARRTMTHTHDDECWDAEGWWVCDHSEHFDEVWEYEMVAIDPVTA